MTGLEALQALRESKFTRIRRKEWDKDMHIRLNDEINQVEISREYDEYIKNEFSLDITYGEFGHIVECSIADLIYCDDWEMVE